MWLKFLLPGINAIISLVTILILIFRNNKTEIVRSYIMLSTSWLNWSLGVIFTMLWGRDPFGEYLFWLKNLSAFTMGPMWMIFSIYYTNSKIISDKSKVYKFFSIWSLPLVLYIVSITNKYHGWFFEYADQVGLEDYKNLISVKLQPKRSKLS